MTTMLKFRHRDFFDAWSRPQGGTTSIHSCLWGLSRLSLIRRISGGTSPESSLRRSWLAVNLRKTSVFLRSRLNSCSPLSAPQAASEEEGGEGVFSPFQSQVLLCSPKVVGKAGQEQASWTNFWFNQAALGPDRRESSFQVLYSLGIQRPETPYCGACQCVCVHKSSVLLRVSAGILAALSLCPQL